MEKLKRCPFCGSEAHLVRSCKIKRLDETVMMGVLVICSGCKASNYARTDEDAISKWNRRSEQDDYKNHG